MDADARCTGVLNSVYVAETKGLKLKAVTTLISYFDDLFNSGKFETAKLAIECVDLNKLSTAAITGMLTITWHARTELGPTRTALVNRTLAFLKDNRGFTEERLKSLEDRCR